MKTNSRTRSLSLFLSLALLGTSCASEGVQPTCEGGVFSPESYLFTKPGESNGASRIILVSKRSEAGKDILPFGEKNVNSAIYVYDSHIQPGDWNVFTKESSVSSSYEDIWIMPFIAYDEPLSGDEEICVDATGVYRRK
jgi:hypothetical protein